MRGQDEAEAEHEDKIIPLIKLFASIMIMLGALCWTLLLLEGLQTAQEYGFVIKHNLIHAGGVGLFIIFLIFFPLDYLLRKVESI